jgi:hypothetical protein
MILRSASIGMNCLHLFFLQVPRSFLLKGQTQQVISTSYVLTSQSFVKALTCLRSIDALQRSKGGIMVDDNNVKTGGYKREDEKEAINEVLRELTKDEPSVYYLSTIEIAEKVKTAVEEGKYLDKEKLALLKGLSKSDIQMLMSFHPE